MKHKAMALYNLVFALIITFGLTSCAKIHHLPVAQQVDSRNIQEFNINKSFRVINNQPSKENLILGKFYLGSFYSSLFEFTDAAVKSLNSELSQRGMTISNDADKVLKLAVIDAQISEVGFRWKCAVSLDIETEEGYKSRYIVNNLTPSNTRVCGGAITLAITDLLNDQQVISYLNEQE
jgi:hypothetical protein